MAGPIPCKGLVVGDVPAPSGPFTDQEMEVFDLFLRRVNLTVDQIHFTTVVQEVLPDRRSPTRDEIHRGLVEVVATGRKVDPSYTLLCGRVAAGAFFPRTLRVASGRFRDVRGLSYPRGGRAWMFTWHPRQVLRNPLMQDEFAMDVSLFGTAVYEANRDVLYTGQRVIDANRTVRIPFT